jgi:hypothetical protein
MLTITEIGNFFQCILFYGWLNCKKPGKELQLNHTLSMEQKIKKFDPAVDKRILIALSGTAWFIVGIILLRLAATWLLPIAIKSSLLIGLTGITLSLLIHHLGFLKLADQNIERIMAMKNKVCIFAFQAWKSYAIIATMVGIGIALRHSPLPRPYLSVIYIGFGGAMVLSSVRYLRVFFKLVFHREKTDEIDR